MFTKLTTAAAMTLACLTTASQDNFIADRMARNLQQDTKPCLALEEETLLDLVIFGLSQTWVSNMSKVDGAYTQSSQYLDVGKEFTITAADFEAEGHSTLTHLSELVNHSDPKKEFVIFVREWTNSAA